MTPAGVLRLMADEGIVLNAAGDAVAYPDPYSPLAQACIKAGVKNWQLNWRKLPGGSKLSGHPWTIGYGHTGPDVGPDTVWTVPQAKGALIADIADHEADLFKALPWVKALDPVRRDVLANMAFNMGLDNPRTPKVEGLSAFTRTLSAIKAGRWALASRYMLQSLWADQVGDRAGRLAVMMLAGEYVDTTHQA